VCRRTLGDPEFPQHASKPGKYSELTIDGGRVLRHPSPAMRVG
jgi:hypothetical protein